MEVNSHYQAASTTSAEFMRRAIDELKLWSGVKLAPANSPFKRYRTFAFSNIALSCLHLEDFGRGLKAAEISVAESGEPHTSAELVSRVLRENYYTRLLLEVGNVDKAGERCELV